MCQLFTMHSKVVLITGGFQMVSLSKLAEVTEEGVNFTSPHTDEMTLLTPEESIRIQNNLGADIIMQLDDVVHVLTTGARVEEAMHRSVRWLDRCTGVFSCKNTALRKTAEVREKKPLRGEQQR